MVEFVSNQKHVVYDADTQWDSLISLAGLLFVGLACGSAVYRILEDRHECHMEMANYDQLCCDQFNRTPQLANWSLMIGLAIFVASFCRRVFGDGHFHEFRKTVAKQADIELKSHVEKSLMRAIEDVTRLVIVLRPSVSWTKKKLTFFAAVHLLGIPVLGLILAVLVARLGSGIIAITKPSDRDVNDFMDHYKYSCSGRCLIGPASENFTFTCFATRSHPAELWTMAVATFVYSFGSTLLAAFVWRLRDKDSLDALLMYGTGGNLPAQVFVSRYKQNIRILARDVENPTGALQ
jgi:hypothetical protein